MLLTALKSVLGENKANECVGEHIKNTLGKRARKKNSKKYLNFHAEWSLKIIII